MAADECSRNRRIRPARWYDWNTYGVCFVDYSSAVEQPATARQWNVIHVCHSKDDTPRTSYSFT